MKDYNEISDLGLAATLSAMGFTVRRLDRTNPRRIVFVFDQLPEVRENVDKFYDSQLLLPADVLLEHIRKLKNRIYSQ